MDYLAIPQKTAGWLLGKAALLEALAADLPALATNDALRKGVIVAGPLRILASRSGSLLALWNVDYLSGTGAEPWGVVRLSDPFGLLSEPEIIREVLLRQLQVIDRRLQGFLLDSSWMMRSELQGLTTCIAGGGKAWKDFRIGYVEGEGTTDHSVVRGVLLTGPAWEDNSFRNASLRELNALRALLPEANSFFIESTSRPTLEHTTLQVARAVSARTPGDGERTVDGVPVSLPALQTVAAGDVYETLAWTYDDWLANSARLTATQRTVLLDDIIERQPVRIVGAAGSGKTLLMMLLSIRQLRKARQSGHDWRAIYVAHNSAMREKAWSRLNELGAGDFLDPRAAQRLEVRTLFDYAREVLGISDLLLIDRDADASKRYQRGVVVDAIRRVFSNHRDAVEASTLFSQVCREAELFESFADLIVDEVSVAIKGQGMSSASDARQYVESEKRLSRVHGVLRQRERQIVWEIFLRYQEDVAREHGLLDADDLALSLLGRLKTPLWELQRAQVGYDVVFIDEAQLFNENEKRLFPLLAKRGPHVPLVIALDQAQQVRALTSAGLGALGVEDVRSETLRSVHRCSDQILKLAFFVIQHTTDLFGADFPDFTRDTSSQHDVGERPPRLLQSSAEFSPEVAARVVGELRLANRRQIAVVCFAARYWNSLRDELGRGRDPVRVIEGRGELLPARGKPLIAVARPDAIGGQEFDAVVCVGLEQGVVPLVVNENETLSAALEQQALREMYVAFTRARTDLIVVVGRGSAPNAILQSALEQRFISADSMLPPSGPGSAG
ncbi:MAG: UvrD-helicase domain-containing protein [Deltaproteobacteria bacterium]|nr:UvrD-helicase domain-containing protein [Deltaproteobacteria bacterium]